MASRGRDLEFTIISDDSRFDVDQVAQGLEDMARSAQDAARDLVDLDRDTSRLDLDQIGDDAKATAREVDDAFDTISRSARTGASKVDDSTDKMERSLRDVKGEASDTSREMAASFSDGGDLADGFQELAANAGQYFGPIGEALGLAGAIGLGLFLTETQKLKDEVAEIVEALIEGGGRIDDAFVDVRVGELAKSGELKKIRDLVEQVEIAGLTYEDLARAKAGDVEAAERVNEALTAEEERRKSTTAELETSEAAIALVAATLDTEREAMRLAQEAAKDYEAATTTAAERSAAATKESRDGWDGLRSSMAESIVGKVTVQGPSASQLSAIRANILRGIGTVTVPVNPRPNTGMGYGVVRRIP